MAYFHGARSSKIASSVSSPTVAQSGIVVVIGTVPIQAAEEAREIAYLTSYEDAVKYCGYSDDWGKYTACEQIYAHFKLFRVAPLVVINALDITKHKKSEVFAPKQIVDGVIELPFETIKMSVKVKAEEASEEFFAESTDYELSYDNTSLKINVLSGGGLEKLTAAYVAYEAVVPEMVEKSDIIDAIAKIDSVYPKLGIIPDIAVSPVWGEDTGIAALLAASMEMISTVFKGGIAYIDLDTKEVKSYDEAPAYKKQKNLTADNMYLLWPRVKTEDRVFHFSTIAAALTAATDAEEGCPAESPSNLSIRATGMTTDDGTEIDLTLAQANFLNQNGIATALSFSGGLNLWGNELACYPTNTDVSSYMLPAARMFGWVANTVLLTHWGKVDRKQNRRLIDNVVDTINIWLNGLTPDTILSGYVETISAENPQTDVIAGITKYHIHLAPCSPNREMDFILEYDAEAAGAALSL